jgi:mono/diheme cytochrome c family protein
MNISNFMKVVVAGSILTVGVLFCVAGPDSTLSAQEEEGGGGRGAGQGQGRGGGQGRGAAPQAPAPYKEMPVDKYDRNATLWAHERSGFKSGWQRGREVYFQNCWMCHSEYVIAGDWAPAPTLRDVTKRLTDAQITAKIQTGGGRMPAFKQLTDADIKDLLTLMHEKCGTFPTGGGCFDEHNPPPNPLYRFGTEYLAPNAVDAVDAAKPQAKP